MLALAFSAPAGAQDETGAPPAANPVTAEQALAAAKAAYAAPAGPPPPECPAPADGSEIVVCAEKQEQGQFRVRPTTRAEAEYAAATMNRGRPGAPSFEKPPCVASLLTFCGGGGRPLHRPAMIDLAAIPEPPPGSDADRIARGERAQ